MPILSTVEWKNEDPSGSPPVTVTSQPGSTESFDYTIQPGKWDAHTFEHIGTYKYFDKNTAGHKGEIIVEEVVLKSTTNLLMSSTSFQNSI